MVLLTAAQTILLLSLHQDRGWAGVEQQCSLDTMQTAQSAQPAAVESAHDAKPLRVAVLLLPASIR